MTVDKTAVALPPASWWSSSPDARTEVGGATYARWSKKHGTDSALEEEDVLGAMAFGYAAHGAYGSLMAWKELEPHLVADWQQAGLEAEHNWDKMRGAVKAGWGAARARGASESKAGEPSWASLEVSKEEEPSIEEESPTAPPDPEAAPTAPKRDVPGGRIHM